MRTKAVHFFCRPRRMVSSIVRTNWFRSTILDRPTRCQFVFPTGARHAAADRGSRARRSDVGMTAEGGWPVVTMKRADQDFPRPPLSPMAAASATLGVRYAPGWASTDPRLGWLPVPTRVLAGSFGALAGGSQLASAPRLVDPGGVTPLVVAMRIVSNTGTDRVVDLIQPWLQPGNQMDLASEALSLHSFGELAERLSRVARTRLVLPPADAELGLFGADGDRAVRNRLQGRWLASRCADWVEKTVEVRRAERPVPQGAVLLRNGDGAHSRPCSGRSRSVPTASAWRRGTRSI